jgi:membrane protein DedA with SNARE-associated domain/rhodanese-related sulfurtransferase
MTVLTLGAVVAAVIADLGWYLAGRRYGNKIIATLCRVSLSPDSCVRQTELAYGRWGPASLLFAKFIPGFASVASALSGTAGTRQLHFLIFDALGTALWAGSAIYLGSLFSTTIDSLLGVLEELGKWGVLLLLVALGVFVAKKWWQRHRFIRSLRMARISVSELYGLLQGDNPPAIIDARSLSSQEKGRIPGAITIAFDGTTVAVPDVPAGREVIVYCACPNEASAARIAKRLMQQGYSRVRPLHGGIDAWIEAGYSLDSGLPISQTSASVNAGTLKESNFSTSDGMALSR